MTDPEKDFHSAKTLSVLREPVALLSFAFIRVKSLLLSSMFVHSDKKHSKCNFSGKGVKHIERTTTTRVKLAVSSKDEIQILHDYSHKFCSHSHANADTRRRIAFWCKVWTS